VTTASGAAFRALLDLLRDADAGFAAAGLDALGVAEGYRHLTHLLGYAFDLYLEGDAERPVFTPLASPTRKILGDNVDSHYWFAPLRGERAYRISGVRGNGVYLAFCVYGGKPDGEWSERVVANVSQRDIVFAPDGGFALVLAADPAPAGDAQWVRIDADAVCVISREYFTDPRAARPASGSTRSPRAHRRRRSTASGSPAGSARSRRSCARRCASCRCPSSPRTSSDHRCPGAPTCRDGVRPTTSMRSAPSGSDRTRR
jgi:hypothetical protein